MEHNNQPSCRFTHCAGANLTCSSADFCLRTLYLTAYTAYCTVLHSMAVLHFHRFLFLGPVWGWQELLWATRMALHCHHKQTVVWELFFFACNYWNSAGKWAGPSSEGWRNQQGARETINSNASHRNSWDLHEDAGHVQIFSARRGCSCLALLAHSHL